MKKILLYLILIMAVGLAGTVAYVSVTGLMKVFTGAGTAGLIFFIGIEVAKVIATSAIHTYGKRIGWFYNILLSLGIVIAMAITSMGIYGFLSSSYKESFAEMENVGAQVELLEKKRDGYTQQFDILTEEKTSLNTTIMELTKGLSNNVIQYKDPETGEIITTTSSSTRKVLQEQLDNAIERQGVVNTKSDSLSTIIFDLENEILEVKLGDEATSELGTLQYLSDITGASMDTVMSWFIFLLIVIGDPMAVLMVIVFNKVVNYKKEEDDGADDGGDDNPEPVIPNNENLEEYHIYMDDKPAKIEELTSDINEDYMNQIQKNIREDEVIEDDAVNEVVNDTVNEVVEVIEETVEETVEEEVERFEDSVEGMIQNNKKEKVQMDAEEPVVEDDFVDEDEVDEDEVENTPEEQIEENIDEVNKLTREPIIPRGKIIKEDIIKEDRGFSVHIPDPEPKEEETPKQHFFQRKRTDELGDD
jgi:hypothetical protein